MCNYITNLSLCLSFSSACFSLSVLFSLYFYRFLSASFLFYSLFCLYLLAISICLLLFFYYPLTCYLLPIIFVFYFFLFFSHFPSVSSSWLCPTSLFFPSPWSFPLFPPPHRCPPPSFLPKALHTNAFSRQIFQFSFRPSAILETVWPFFEWLNSAVFRAVFRGKKAWGVRTMTRRSCKHAHDPVRSPLAHELGKVSRSLTHNEPTVPLPTSK